MEKVKRTLDIIVYIIAVVAIIVGFLILPNQIKKWRLKKIDTKLDELDEEEAVIDEHIEELEDDLVEHNKKVEELDKMLEDNPDAISEEMEGMNVDEMLEYLKKKVGEK